MSSVRFYTLVELRLLVRMTSDVCEMYPAPPTGMYKNHIQSRHPMCLRHKPLSATMCLKTSRLKAYLNCHKHVVGWRTCQGWALSPTDA